MKDFFGFGNSGKRKTEEFSYYVKIKTVQKQGNLCAKCNQPFAGSGKPVFDYKNRVCSDNSEENCQALHANCYDTITRKDDAERTISNKKEYPELPTHTDNTFYNLDYKDLI